jgi:hypothetical protein
VGTMRFAMAVSVRVGEKENLGVLAGVKGENE